MSNKKQGWYVYEEIAFIPSDHNTMGIYKCSNCRYKGAYLIPKNRVDEELYCNKCKCAVVIEEYLY